jgi:hypothetical protein
MVYLSALSLAAVWAIAERTCVAIARRTPAEISPVDVEVDAVESMTARELEVEREAADLLLRA